MGYGQPYVVSGAVLGQIRSFDAVSYYYGVSPFLCPKLHPVDGVGLNQEPVQFFYPREDDGCPYSGVPHSRLVVPSLHCAISVSRYPHRHPWVSMNSSCTWTQLFLVDLWWCVQLLNRMPTSSLGRSGSGDPGIFDAEDGDGLYQNFCLRPME